MFCYTAKEIPNILLQKAGVLMPCLDITLLMLLKETNYTCRVLLDTDGNLMWVESLSDLPIAVPFLFESSLVS